VPVSDNDKDLNTDIPYTLTFISLNVLHDLSNGVVKEKPQYNYTHLLHNQLRRIQIFELLDKTGADFIALQEVTPDFYKLLMDLPWVQKNYYLSDISTQSLEPSGNVLMSKYPFQESFLWLYTVSQKKFSLGLFLINQRILSVAVVHLKAGQQDHYVELRSREISQTISIQSICGYDDAVILGDFNFQEVKHEGNEQLDETFVDCWRFCHGKDPGWTRDKNKNSLARKMSEISYQVKNLPIPTTYTGDRYDRIYLSSSIWHPNHMKLIADKPCGKSEDGLFDIFPSDHFGISLEIGVSQQWVRRWMILGVGVIVCVVGVVLYHKFWRKVPEIKN